MKSHLNKQGDTMSWKDILKEELTMESVISMLESKGLTLVDEEKGAPIYDGIDSGYKSFVPKENSIGEKLYKDHFAPLLVRNMGGIKFQVPVATRLVGRRVYRELTRDVATRSMEHAEDMAELYLKRHKEAEKTFHSTPDSFDPRYR